MQRRFEENEAAARRKALEAKILGSDEYREEVAQVNRNSEERADRLLRRSTCFSGSTRISFASSIGILEGGGCKSPKIFNIQQSLCTCTLRDRGDRLGQILWKASGLIVQVKFTPQPLALFLRQSLPNAFAASHGRCRCPGGGSGGSPEHPMLPNSFYFPPLDYSPHLPCPSIALCAVHPSPDFSPLMLGVSDTSGNEDGGAIELNDMEVFQPFVGESLVIVQNSPDGLSETKSTIFEVTARTSEPSSLGVTGSTLVIKMVTDPLDDADFMEGSPICRRTDSGSLLPIALYTGRCSDRRWAHEALPLAGAVNCLISWQAENEAKLHLRSQAHINVAKAGVRQLVRNRAAFQLDKIAKTALKASKNPISAVRKEALAAECRSPEDGAVLAELAEERGIDSILTLLGPYEAIFVRQHGMQALARLLGRHPEAANHTADATTRLVVSSTEADWLGDSMQASGCLALAMIALTPANAQVILAGGGLRVIIQSLRDCIIDPVALDRYRIQFWALAALGNLLPVLTFQRIEQEEQDVLDVVLNVACLPLPDQPKEAEKLGRALAHVVREIWGSGNQNLSCFVSKKAVWGGIAKSFDAYDDLDIEHIVYAKKICTQALQE